MLLARLLQSLILAAALLVALSGAQSQEVDDSANPAHFRPAWTEKATDTAFEKVAKEISRLVLGLARVAAPEQPYVLDTSERARYPGTFGIDFSHHNFDLDHMPDDCKTQENYDSPNCSCSMDWSAIGESGFRFVYLKASDGRKRDLSFAKNWRALEQFHNNGVLYRGAFHFLEPGVDAATQAQNFLDAIGAANGQKPKQLPPSLDIEWTNTPITPGTPEFNACPSDRKAHSNEHWRCDMWYKMTAAEIATLAKQWIEIVERATGRPVVIYTNVTAWWNDYMGVAGEELAKHHAMWLSRYTDEGPKYKDEWASQNGSARWHMPPLPRGAIYPTDQYSVAHFWQFTETAHIPPAPYTCRGEKETKESELNWLPVSGHAFVTLFGVGSP
jgi:GH25 family lysozyme M1 (1,4-beta-N-acetylmuramidase)